MAFEPGANIGPYRVLEQLGQGGMATVFKAYHAALDRCVALKVLHPSFLEDKNFLARFEREAKLIARLEHIHIVPVYDFSNHEGQPYLVMKFIEGETLKAQLASGPLSARETLEIVVAVGSALSYAHRQGILHRDIKPSNILLDKDDNIYLADFGLARIASAGASTMTGDMIVGTPQYISPEQAMGISNLDEGTDIYSFGVMLYEMVVGRVPFDADTPFSVIQDHIYAPLPLPSVVNPKISFELERVLLKVLAKKRPDRHATVKDLVEAFREAWQVTDEVVQRPEVSMPGKEVATITADEIPINASLQTKGRKVFPLDRDICTIGRQGEQKKVLADIDVTALDTGKLASRLHVTVELSDGTFYVSDMGSTNGTYLNGEKLKPHEPRTLKAGDVIELGKYGVRFTFLV
ncbi:MAG: FHA domain-containing serine/threonine-protein kinase [Anaerolineales bacterium]|nr:FHA domain-containing serine/threonine-protein kinase [Anaerolineales bacterium]